MARKLGSGTGEQVESVNPNAEARREQAGNVTHTTFLAAVREIAKVNAEARAVNEKRKGIRKKWKAEGLELGILDATIKMAEWDRAEVRAHFDNGRKYAEWLGLPIGSQPDLFARKGEDAIQKGEWYALGKVASRLGKAAKPPEECPAEYHQAYMAGFNNEDESAWTEAEQHEAQNVAAAAVDPEKPGNISDIRAALETEPAGRMRRRASAAVDPVDDRDTDDSAAFDTPVVH